MILQNFSIRALDNDTPDSPIPETIQYTIQWGDLQNREVLTYLGREHGGDALEDCLLKDMFLKMCLKAWDEANIEITREKVSCLERR